MRRGTGAALMSICTLVVLTFALPTGYPLAIPHALDQRGDSVSESEAQGVRESSFQLTTDDAETINNTGSGGLQVPSSDSAARPLPALAPRSYFPVGVFAGSAHLGTPARFDEIIQDLRRHSLDSIMIVNGTVTKADEYLRVADRHQGFNVYWQNGVQLERQWWINSIPATIETAREVIFPLAETMRSTFHPSLKGHYTKDEPSLAKKEKVRLANQAFREKDPERPAFAVLSGVGQVKAIFDPDSDQVMVLDLYTLTSRYAPNSCEFLWSSTNPKTGQAYDFVDYIRSAATVKPKETPLWMILQTHNFQASNPSYSLRQPTVAEVRAQQWLAVGEGATGIIWFTYPTEQGWIGLKDNPTLYDEVADLARRLKTLEQVLLRSYAADDRFVMSGMPAGTPGYASSLLGEDGKHYVVAVNRSCSAQTLSIDSTAVEGNLKDLETGYVHPFNTPLAYRAGDARVFEVMAE